MAPPWLRCTGTVVSTGFSIVRLAGRLSVVLLVTGASRWRAVRAFRRGLADAGLPPEAIRELTRAFPRLPGCGWMNLGRYGHGLRQTERRPGGPATVSS